MGTWWKDVEYRVAQLLQGERIPITGRRGMPDVVGSRLAVEVKARRAFPRWLERFLDQARLGAIEWRAKRGEELFPVVWLHKKGQFWGDDWVIMRASDFMELLWTSGLDTEGTTQRPENGNGGG